jgi:hypothetical protein
LNLYFHKKYQKSCFVSFQTSIQCNCYQISYFEYKTMSNMNSGTHRNIIICAIFRYETPKYISIDLHYKGFFRCDYPKSHRLLKWTLFCRIILVPHKNNKIYTCDPILYASNLELNDTTPNFVAVLVVTDQICQYFQIPNILIIIYIQIFLFIFHLWSIMQRLFQTNFSCMHPLSFSQSAIKHIV